MSIFDFDDYRDILKQELTKRKKNNPRYSLRAFARDLDLYQSKLSEILSGKQGMSHSSGVAVAQRLRLNTEESEYFMLLIEHKHARSKTSRDLAKVKLRKFSHLESVQMRNDLFKLISSWEHMAIMEVIQLTNAKTSPSAIAEALDVPEKKIKECIARLLKYGLVVREGRKLKRATLQHYTWGENVPSDSIKEFHKQILQRSIQALYSTPFEKRDIRTSILSVSEEDLPLVEQKIQQTSMEINKLLYKSKKKDKVYVFSCQFFPIDAR